MQLASILLSGFISCAGVASAVIAMEWPTGQVSRTVTEQVLRAEPEIVDASLLLPGDFSEQTTLADLRLRFGTANVQVVDAVDDAGTNYRSVVLFPDDASRRAYVNFHDEVVLQGLAGISVRDTGSRWRGKHGVHVGMSFAALRVLNGKPFYLDGFDDRNRGRARDQWSPSLDDSDATLGKFDVEQGDHMYFGVEFGLRSDTDANPAADIPKHQMVYSDDRRYPRLGELFEVTEISAYTSLDDDW